jgi:hypothetical protein
MRVIHMPSSPSARPAPLIEWANPPSGTALDVAAGAYRGCVITGLPGQGSFRPVLWADGQVVLGSARRQTMLERFTDEARRVVVLAEE